MKNIKLSLLMALPFPALMWLFSIVCLTSPGHLDAALAWARQGFGCYLFMVVVSYIILSVSQLF